MDSILLAEQLTGSSASTLFRRGVLLGCALGIVATACDAKGPRERAPNVELPDFRPTLNTSSALAAHEPAPPVTLSELVEEGRHWRLATPHGPIHVWIPRGYKEKRAETIVYVHGYYTHVDEAWKDHRLASQFASAAINAMFVACEAPAGFEQPVAWESLTELLDAVERGTRQRRPRRRIVAVGHSGAFRTLLNWLDEPVLDTVVLLDAAYGEIESYRSWVLASPKHRLIDVGDDTRKWTEELHKLLPNSVVLDGFPSVEDEIPRSAAKAKILYIRSTIGHFPLVTAGVALPMVLRTLTRRRLLDVPLAALLEAP